MLVARAGNHSDGVLGKACNSHELRVPLGDSASKDEGGVVEEDFWCQPEASARI